MTTTEKGIRIKVYITVSEQLTFSPTGGGGGGKNFSPRFGGGGGGPPLFFLGGGGGRGGDWKSVWWGKRVVSGWRPTIKKKKKI